MHGEDVPLTAGRRSNGLRATRFAVVLGATNLPEPGRESFPIERLLRVQGVDEMVISVWERWGHLYHTHSTAWFVIYL